MSSGLIVDSRGRPLISPKRKKRYNLTLEIAKAIHSGAFFGLQKHSATWLLGALHNNGHARNACAG